jgi:streptogramin lyase
VALSGRNLWVTSFRGQAVTRIDAKTGRVRDARLVVGAGATDVAAGYGSIWITNSRTNSLIRADAQTGKQIGSALVLPQSPVLVTTGEGAVWVAGRPPLGTPGTSTIFRVDPRGAQLVDTISVLDRLRSIAVGREAVWALTSAALIRISVTSGRQSRVAGAGLDPKHVAVGTDAVWVTNAGEDTVTRIGIPSARATHISVGAAPSHVEVQGRNVWVTNFEDHSLSRIDARTRRVTTRPARVRRNPFALAVGHDQVWVTSVGDNAVTKMSYR